MSAQDGTAAEIAALPVARAGVALVVIAVAQLMIVLQMMCCDTPSAAARHDAKHRGPGVRASSSAAPMPA